VPARLLKTAVEVSFGAALRVSVVLWTFAIALVVALTVVRGRGTALQTIIIQIPLWLLGILLSIVLYWAWRKVRSRSPVLVIPVMAATCVVLSVFITAVDLNYLRWLHFVLFSELKDWTVISVERFTSVTILYSWTFGLNASLYWSVSMGEAAREQGRRAAVAEAETQRAQLAALRLQLNPHFLFNTLNAISAMVIEKDSERADQMIDRLSEFLRTSLTTDPNAMIVLGEEFDTIEAYLEIEMVRFEERLKVRFQCDEALRRAVVPGFILQPLVENAMKYAVAPAMRAVQVTIEARRENDDLILVVADDGDPVAAASRAKGFGVGLGNTRARLANLYGERGVLSAEPSDAGFRVEVRLPLTLSVQELPEAAKPAVA